MLTLAFFILILLAVLLVAAGFMDAAQRIFLFIAHHWELPRGLLHWPLAAPAKINLFQDQS